MNSFNASLISIRIRCVFENICWACAPRCIESPYRSSGNETCAEASMTASNAATHTNTETMRTNKNNGHALLTDWQQCNKQRHNSIIPLSKNGKKIRIHQHRWWKDDAKICKNVTCETKKKTKKKNRKNEFNWKNDAKQWMSILTSANNAVALQSWMYLHLMVFYTHAHTRTHSQIV